MKKFLFLIALALNIFVCGTLLSSDAARVYVMSSGDPNLDNIVAAVLTANGHNAVIGVQYTEFDGTQDLSGVDVIYFQANYNWASGNMPEDGQLALLGWLEDPAHGLVTAEWVVWLWGVGAFQIIGDAFAVEPIVPYRYSEFATFTLGAPDATLNAGMPNDFTFAVNNYAGTETHLTPRPDGIVFYHSDYESGGVPGAGLVGGIYLGSGGRVLHFSTCNGPDQITDSNFGRLLGNAMDWAASGASETEGDVNGDGCVDDADLLAVLFNFGGDDPDADLNNDGIVDDADLLLVLFNFGNGC
jgi:hypothetical protein